MESPLVLVGGGQLELVRGLQELRAAVEAVDAQLYRAYDAKGRHIRLAGKYDEQRLLGLTVVSSGEVTAEVADHEPGHAEELRLALAEWWTRTGGATRQDPSPGAETWSLERLIAAVMARDGAQ